MDSNQDEVWVTHPQYPNYKISNYGNVKNKYNRMLKPFAHHQSRYLQIDLADEYGKIHKSILVHLLVAELFLNDTMKKTVDHIDRDRHNNYYKNLRYATHKEQTENSSITKGYIKLTICEVHDICDKLSKGHSISRIVESNGKYTKSRVEKIRQHVRWTHISVDYIW